MVIAILINQKISPVLTLIGNNINRVDKYSHSIWNMVALRINREHGVTPRQPRYCMEDESLKKPLVDMDAGKVRDEDDSESGDLPYFTNNSFGGKVSVKDKILVF